MQKDNFKIFIFDNGFVFIAQEVERKRNRQLGYVRLTECFNIRRWDTGKGLGSLRNRFGPANVTLDFEGNTEHRLAKLNYTIELASNHEFNPDDWKN